ncbi:MAG: hypothetical protein Tsb0015_10030 [Simkaniaceae bacterium]
MNEIQSFYSPKFLNVNQSNELEQKVRRCLSSLAEQGNVTRDSICKANPRELHLTAKERGAVHNLHFKEGDFETETLIAILQSFPKLEKLHLEGNPKISEKKKFDLAKILPYCSELKELHLINISFPDEVFQNIFDSSKLYFEKPLLDSLSAEQQEEDLDFLAEKSPVTFTPRQFELEDLEPEVSFAEILAAERDLSSIFSSKGEETPRMVLWEKLYVRGNPELRGSILSYLKSINYNLESLILNDCPNFKQDRTPVPFRVIHY